MTDDAITEGACACSPHGLCLAHFASAPVDEREKWVPKCARRRLPATGRPAALETTSGASAPTSTEEA